MSDLPLNALRTFAAVYETGGVRPASRALNVAHSSVSRHLRELEKALGIDLFEPREGTRALTFTPQGETLGRAALESFGRLTEVVRSLREAPRRNAVTISTTPSIAALWLLPRLPSFEKAYPGIGLSVIAEQKLVPPDTHGADVAIRMGSGPWPGLSCEPLMDDELYPVMSRDYWEASGRPEKVASLSHLRLLHDRDPNAAWSHWLSQYSPRATDKQVGPWFSSSDLVLRAASHGLGVALARGRLAAGLVETGSLVRPFNDKVISLPNAYWIVQLASPTKRAAVSAVISWLKSQGTTSVLIS